MRNPTPCGPGCTIPEPGFAELFVDGRAMPLAVSHSRHVLFCNDIVSALLIHALKMPQRSPSLAADGGYRYYGYENLTNASAMGFHLADREAVAGMAAALRDGPLWLHGFWKYDWMDTRIEIASIDPGGTFIRNNATAPQLPFTDGCRFVAIDSLSFLVSSTAISHLNIRASP